jgi:8-oxo-dGTP pyrophosphatase MutT (NUDIX family)
MYKVFCNNRVIVLAGQNDKPDEGIYPSTFTELVSKEQVSSIIKDFLNNNEPELNVRYSDLNELWEIFRAQFRLIRAAGGVVYKNDEALIIFRNGKWDLPKGKIEKGETPEEASLREVEEECGLTDLKIRKRLDPTYHIYKNEHMDSSKEWILKETSWFAMEYSGSKIPEPQTEEGITDVKWIGTDEISLILANTWDSLIPLIGSIFHSS